jgi:HK97 family phage major capsid protein
MPFQATLAPEATLSDVRSQLGAAAEYAIGLRAQPSEQRGESYEADVRSALDFINFADPLERAMRAAEDGQRQTAIDARNQGTGGRSMGADLDNERRSMGRQVTDDEGYAEWASSGRRGGPFTIEVRNLISGSTLAGNDLPGGSNADVTLPVGSPINVPGAMQRRRQFLRDLMSVQSTGLRVIPYFRETSELANETGAQMTAEVSAKAEVNINFVGYNAVIEKITAWLPASEEILTDAPTLRGYIDTRLEYMLMIREEDQILNGTGASPQIQGVTGLADRQTQTIVAGDFPATIGQAIGKIENVDGYPTGVVSNPLDYWVAVTRRFATSFDNGQGSGGSPGTPDGNITWGLPCVRTRAVTSGFAWVADWMMGATLFDRQETTIKVGDQHSDFFIRNLLAILGEKRMGVAWHRGNLFVRATVPTS